MTYIKLEDVQKVVNDNQGSYSINILSEINSLPSIDPQAMIKEMIEDELMCECSITRIRTLEDVLGKVKGVPPDRINLS